ncbi:unnamed protein product [Phytomonas sp. Hart1]|nr:unnamed protein product [Phytomonas sp. Hart1]|eukprot:CCW67714.1 unnamed protein product [Phytomonas sp. isolate Hart1]
MIPRNDGHVRPIRPIDYKSNKERQNTSTVDRVQQSRVRITRYPILTPSQFSGTSFSTHESMQSSKPPVRSREPTELNASSSSVPGVHTIPVEANLRLYSFIPTLECPEAPPSLQMQLPEYYIQRQKDLASGEVPKEGSTSGAQWMDGDEDDTAIEDDEWITTAVATTGAATQHFRPKHRSQSKVREPTRCVYSATYSDSNTSTTREFSSSAATLQLSSVPLSEYEKHTCVLLQPLTWPLTAPAARDLVDDLPPVGASGAQPALTALVLEGPLMELRGDRMETTAAHGEDAQGISPAWLSSSSTRVNKREWKSMDAMDKEEARSSGSRWQTEEATDNDRDRIEAEKRHLKKVRTEALQGWSAKAAQEAGDSLEDRWSLFNRHRDPYGSSFVAPPKVPQQVLSHEGDNDQISMPTPKQPPASIRFIHRTRSLEGSPQGEGEKRTTRTITVPTSSTVPIAGTQPKSNGSSASSIPTAAQLRLTLKTGSNGHDHGGELAELGEQARQVVIQLLCTEGRTVVSLKELEKLILKRLKSYTSAAEKAKSSATKAEAVQWFARAQAALRQWLKVENHVLDPGGNVTLSGAK